MKLFFNTIRKLNYILNKPQKLLSLAALLLTLLGSVLECIGVAAIIPIITILLDDSGYNTIKAYIPWEVNNKNEVAMLVIAGVIFLYIFKNLFFIFLSWFRVTFSSKIQREISVDMMESYMSRGYQFYLNKEFGEINRGIREDTGKIYTVIFAGFKLISDFITILLICVFMLSADFKLSLSMIGLSCACIIAISKYYGNKMNQAGETLRESQGNISQTVHQSFEGVKDVLLYRKQRFFIDNFEKYVISEQRCLRQIQIGQEIPAYLIEGICVSGIMITVGIRIVTSANNAEFVAVLAAFAVSAFRVLPCLGRISISLNQVSSSAASLDAVYSDILEARQYLKMHPENKIERRKSNGLVDRYITDSELNSQMSQSPNISYKNIKNDIFQKEISIDNLRFKYDGNFPLIIDDITLSIKKGSSVAFVGESGSGKSTLIDIILGLLRPISGQICIDKTSLDDIPYEWSNIIGYVPQSLYMSNNTILENVAFGEYLEEINKDAVLEALRQADLLEFVNGLKDGVMTEIGDRGVRLSGGQRQRIAIARALYRNPEIVVLDEATSALDNETEAEVMKAIDNLSGKVTLIIVAHRLSTVKKCDVIYEVKQGKLIRRDELKE